MAPDEFVGDLRNDVVDGESPGFARDLGVHHHQQQEIAKFFLKVGIVSSASGFRHLIRFFNCRRQQRFVRLFPVPWTAARRAQFGDDVAKLLEGRGFDHGRSLNHQLSALNLF